MHPSLQAALALAAWFVVTGVLNLLLSKRSRIDAWAEANPTTAGWMKVCRAIGFDPWHLVEAASLFSNGRLSLAMREGKTLPPPPFEKKPSIQPPPPPPPPDSVPPTLGMGVVLLLSLTALGAAQGCATTAPPCSPQNPVMIAKAAECRARVQAECKGIPDSECPPSLECDRWGEERCK